ncbi:type IV pilus modification PilV family protein [Propionivibrio sp.]|uniref:type IV pilus modification PilV family protein n=1 Tax=Propionivibrio sp. TaxID=2212460 RepID=UPI003BF41566
MSKTIIHPVRQTGSVLLESLIAILIFSMGILALVSMQAVAVNASSDAKYRSDATLLANELIGRMWVSDRTLLTLQTNFANPTGTAYQAWAWVGTAAGDAGTQSAPTPGTVLELLPGARAAANLPTVNITDAYLVTITVYWQASNDAPRHKYVTQTQIGG